MGCKKMSLPIIFKKPPSLFSKRVIKLLNRFIILFTVIILSACVSKQRLENQAVITLNNNLAQLTDWQIKGKIAWITPLERKSAYINWQQNHANMQFNLSNVLGINLASLHYDGEIATLEADGQTYTDLSPSRLIFHTTGWHVPLEPLSSWVKGALTKQGRNATSNQQQVIRYENGLIQQIKATCTNCDQWTIDYNSYVNVNIQGIDYQLPQQINMHNPVNQAQIKIKINQWSQ